MIIDQNLGVVDKLCCNISIWNLICFGLVVVVSRCIGECRRKLKMKISILNEIKELENSISLD